MCQQIRLCSNEKQQLLSVDLKMSIVKPLEVQWMLNAYTNTCPVGWTLSRMGFVNGALKMNN